MPYETLALAPQTVRAGIIAVLVIAVVGLIVTGVLPGPVVDLLKVSVPM